MYVNIVEENVMYQQLQKICRGKVCTKKFFGQIWQNLGKISFAPPKNCLLLHLWVTCFVKTQFCQNVSSIGVGNKFTNKDTRMVLYLSMLIKFFFHKTENIPRMVHHSQNAQGLLQSCISKFKV